MGRPKNFPDIYGDLLTEHKSKITADKEYKEYLMMAKVSGPDERRGLVGTPLAAVGWGNCLLLTTAYHEPLTSSMCFENRSKDCRRRRAWMTSTAVRRRSVTAMC